MARLILNTRPADRSQAFTQMLSSNHYQVCEFPLSVQVEMPFVFPDLSTFSHVLFSSVSGPQFVFNKPGEVFPNHLLGKIFSIGKATESEIELYGHKAIGVYKDLKEFADFLNGKTILPQKIVHFCSKQTRLNEEEFFRKTKVLVQNIVSYETKLLNPSKPTYLELKKCDAVVHFSSTSARAFFNSSAYKNGSFEKIHHFTFGTSASEVLLEMGIEFVQSPMPNIKAMVQTLDLNLK